MSYQFCLGLKVADLLFVVLAVVVTAALSAVLVEVQFFDVSIPHHSFCAASTARHALSVGERQKSEQTINFSAQDFSKLKSVKLKALTRCSLKAR